MSTTDIKTETQPTETFNVKTRISTGTEDMSGHHSFEPPAPRRSTYTEDISSVYVPGDLRLQR